MTLLVTDRAGFIGSNFIFYWIKNHPEDRVVCLDKLTYAGNRATLAPVLEHPSFRFVQGDICDREAVDRLLERNGRRRSSTLPPRAMWTALSRTRASF